MVRIEIRGAPDVWSAIAAFETELGMQCARLGLARRVVRAALDAPVPRGASGVSVVFVGGQRRWTVAEQQALEHLVAVRASAVLPVIRSAPSAIYLPIALKPINAFQQDAYDADWPSGLVDEVLAMAWARRRTRKVFVSYKRTDSAPIAGQLYDKLNRLGYETFYDDASIDRGSDFQRELKWWLNDADLLLVLLSPRFSQSLWCVEEIAFSQSRFVGVLVVNWPNEAYADPHGNGFGGSGAAMGQPPLLQSAMPDQQMALSLADFKGAGTAPRGAADLPARELSDAALMRVLAACARQRSVAIRQRLDNLIPLARDVFSTQGPVDAGPLLGDLTFRDEGRRKCFARVLPFRPQPETIFQTYQESEGFDRVGCFYAENDLDDPRARALRWLGGNNFSEVTPPVATSCVWASGGKVL